MEQKQVLWPAIIIILLIAAGAIYYAMTLSTGLKPPAIPSPATSSSTFDTSELDQEGTTIDQSLSEIESILNDYSAADPAEDASGI